MAAVMRSAAADEGPGPEQIEVDRKLWLTAGRDRVVEDGDPAAAFLYATPGQRVPREEAERLGAVAPARKQAERAEDKQAGRAEDKGRARRRGAGSGDAGR